MGDALWRHSNALPAICKGGLLAERRHDASGCFDLAIEVVACAAFSPDQTGLRGIGVDLTAQAQNLHVDGSIIDIVIQAACFEQLVATEDLLGRAYERREQAEFPAGKVKRLTRGSFELACPHAQLESGESVAAQGFVANAFARLYTAQDRAQPRQQLAWAERLRHVV